MKMSTFVLYIGFLVSLFACKKDEPLTDNPANLSVEILSIDYSSLEVTIQALATNTVKYAMYFEGEIEPVLENNSGHFTYKFQEALNYTIEIKAFGSNGKYLKKSVTIELKSDTVSIDNGYITPLTYDGHKLIWSDEFDGTTLNTSKWGYNLGNGCPNNCGWGNNELEYYQKENATVGEGTLTIEAKKQAVSNYNYTSAKIITQGKFSFQYGRIDIRALLPKGQGIWPALWMLGNNISSVGWPSCGEIDIMELIGGKGRENQIHGTLHYEDNGHQYFGKSYSLNTQTFADAYHVFSLIWDQQSLKWYVDDVLFNETDISSNVMSEFHQKFYLIFNVAVGGNWPGNPDATTTFPQKMKVDYVRVFQKNE